MGFIVSMAHNDQMGFICQLAMAHKIPLVFILFLVHIFFMGFIIRVAHNDNLVFITHMARGGTMGFTE